MICPMCNVQGFICKTKVVDLGIDLFICSKCSACWAKDQKISTKTFKNLSTFLEEHGLSYKDVKIKDL